MADLYSRLTQRVAETLAVILFTAVLAVQTLNIFFRYSQLFAPWGWVEEFSKYALIWMFFLLWHLSDRQRRHFVVDFLVTKLPQGARKWLDVIQHLVAIVFSALVVGSSVEYVQSGMGYSTQSIQALPIGVVYAIIPIGVGLVLIERVRMLVHTLRS